MTSITLRQGPKAKPVGHVYIAHDGDLVFEGKAQQFDGVPVGVTQGPTSAYLKALALKVQNAPYIWFTNDD